MKKLLLIFLLFVSTASFAEEDLNLKSQMLDEQILRLTKERDKKWEDLKQCEHNTQGFKIAGITTLVATGIGVWGNIELSKKLKEKKEDTRSNTNGGLKEDTRPEEQKISDECKMFCETDREAASGIGCPC